MVGVRCGRCHAEEGGGEAWVQSRHEEEDGVGGLVGSSAGRGAWPVWQHTRGQGVKGGVWSGWLRLGSCHGSAPAYSAIW
jgi:hypothetical protein